MNTGRAIDNYVSAKNVDGIAAWTYDPVHATGTPAITAATIYLAKLPVPYALTMVNVALITTTAGVDGAAVMSNAQCGVYSSAGTLIASTAAAGTKTALQATAGYQTVALVAESGQSLTLVSGPTAFYWLALHVGVQSTTAVVCRATTAGSPTVNMGLSAATSRFGTYAGHATNNLTTIGALTTASITAAGSPIWMGLT